MDPFEVTPSGLRIRIRVQPKASRIAILAPINGRLRIAVTAPPVDGAANALVIKALAKKLGIAPRCVTVISGLKAREKVVEAQGVSIEEARERLGMDTGV